VGLPRDLVDVETSLRDRSGIDHFSPVEQGKPAVSVERAMLPTSDDDRHAAAAFVEDLVSSAASVGRGRPTRV
jgi:hypothetical protein